MKSSKKSVLVLILMLSLFIFGCQNATNKDSKSLGIFIGGTDGVDFSFITNEPPSSVLDNNQEPFFITLELQNKGEFTVPANKIIASITGINAEAFSLSSLNSKLTIP